MADKKASVTDIGLTQTSSFSVAFRKVTGWADRAATSEARPIIEANSLLILSPEDRCVLAPHGVAMIHETMLLRPAVGRIPIAPLHVCGSGQGGSSDHGCVDANGMENPLVFCVPDLLAKADANPL